VDESQLFHPVVAVPAAIVAVLVIAGGAAAVGPNSLGDVDVAEEDVLQGRSVPMTVTFAPGEETATVTVECRADNCTTWEREVVFDDQAPECQAEGERTCRIAFPEGFEPVDGRGSSAATVGAPSIASTYEVRMDEWTKDRFETHLSTAGTCGHFYMRGQQLVIQTSGHAEGELVTVRVQQDETTRLFESFVSDGQAVAYRFSWRIPLDLPLEPSGLSVQVGSTDGLEEQVFTLERARAQPTIVSQPSGGEPAERERGDTAATSVRYAFPAAPEGCASIVDAAPIPLDGDRASETTPGAVVQRQPRGTLPDDTQHVAEPAARWDDELEGYRLTHQIQDDARRTNNATPTGPSPVYELLLEEAVTPAGNLLEPARTEPYHVVPYRSLVPSSAPIAGLG
jgi:hypothetical protein